jgi:hypothetical protein
MTIGILSWKLRETNGELGEGRGWTLVTLYWHTNAHLRCWPGVRRLAKQTGVALATNDKILDWLVERGAVLKVPYDKRLLEEKALSARKTIYQLTGVIRLDSGWTRYLEIANPETAYSLVTLLHGLDVSLAEISAREFSVRKISPGETEGIYSLEGDTASQGDTGREKGAEAPKDTVPSLFKSPKQLDAFMLQNMAPPALYAAYRAAFPDNAKPTASNADKIKALQAEDDGYTAVEVEALTRRKLYEEKKNPYPFAWLITDLPAYRMEKQKEQPAETKTESTASDQPYVSPFSAAGAQA